MDIFQALDNLKSKIDRINGEPLTENRDGLQDTTQSEQTFINRKLLPKEARIDDAFPDDSAIADYSNHVLQAVWNIAHYASQGYGTAFWNKNIIIEAFKFFDACWVPKVVDNKTYQVGKALQIFLQEALTEEALGHVPSLGGVREGAKTTLTGLQTILNNRLRAYEIHRPERVSDAVEHLKFRVARRVAWDEAADSFAQKVSPFDYWRFFEGELNSEYSQLEESLKILDAYPAYFEAAAEEFRRYSEEWNEENVERNLPDTVQASTYIILLADEYTPLHQKVSELSEVYNSQNYEMWNEQIKNSLYTIYASTEKQIEDIERNYKKMIASQKETLLVRIADSKLLAFFEQNLQKAVSTTEEVIIPEVVQTLMDSPELPISEDIEFYNDLTKMLESYQVSLVKHQKLVEAQIRNFETDNPLPQIHEVGHQSAFVKARDEAKKQLTTKVDVTKQQIMVVNTLLEKTKSNITRLGDELTKQSELGRKNKLEEVAIRIREAFNELHDKFRPKAEEANLQFRRFLESYAPTVAAIEKEYAPQLSTLEETIIATESQILAKKHSSEEIKLRSVERKSLLRRSRTELVQFKKLLIEDQGLYIPAAKIPKELLIKNLECAERITGFINEMYKTEQEATSWYGFNRANLYNKYVHYTTLLGPSDFDFDISSLIDYISEKIELIDQEMQIEVTSDVSAPVSSKDYLLGKGNLWELQKEYQKTQQEKNKLEVKQQTDGDLQQKLTTEMTTKLNEWESLKTKKEEAATLAALEEKINTIDHRQAMIVLNSYEFEFRIADIEKEQKELDDIIKTLDLKDDKEALQYLESMSDKIAATDVDKMMKFKSNFGVYSGTELQKLINDSLKALEGDLDSLIEDQTVGQSEQLNGKLGNLEAEFKELEGKKARLDVSLEQIKKSNAEKMHILNEKKDTLIALNKLTEL
jgi:hypothetical protein